MLSVGGSDVACEGLPAPEGVSAVRTSIGLATVNDDGTFAYSCPTLLGDNPTSVLAASEDGGLIAAVSAGVLSLSADAGCTWRSVALPSGDAFAYEIAGGIGAIWALGRNSTQAWLLRIDAAGTAQIVVTWDRSGEGGWTPDALLPVSGDATDRVVVSGARPVPQLVFVEQTDVGWAAQPTVSLDGVVDGPQRIAPRAFGPDGGVWLHYTTATGRTLGLVLPDGTALALNDAVEVLHGPVISGDAAWVVRDAMFERYSLDGTSFDTGRITPFKCLQHAGGRIFACDLYDMLEITDVEAVFDGTGGTRPVFSTAQIGPPNNACGRSADDAAICDADWTHYGAENYFLLRDPAPCPGGGSGLPDDLAGLDAGTGTDSGAELEADGQGDGRSSGCGAASGGAAWWVWVPVALATRRRPRR